MQDISDTPEDKPSNPSIKLIAFVIPTIQPIVSIKFKTGWITISFIVSILIPKK